MTIRHIQPCVGLIKNSLVSFTKKLVQETGLYDEKPLVHAFNTYATPLDNLETLSPGLLRKQLQT